MKKRLLLAIVLGMFSVGTAWAQGAPKAEFYGGYAFLHSSDLDMHGFLTGFEGRITNNLGIVGEFGIGFKTVSELGVDLSLKDYTFFAGPRFNYRSDKVRVFGEALFGGERIGVGTSVSGMGVNVGTTGFSIALGGGMDLSLNHRISIRLVQFDLIQTQFTLLGVSDWANTYRYSAGIVIK